MAESEAKNDQPENTGAAASETNVTASDANSQAPNGSEVAEAEADDNVFYNEDGQLEHKTGMHWCITGIFLAGELAGAGVIALPSGVRAWGLFVGLGLIGLSFLMAVYTAILLGRSWLILQKVWPEYKHNCRDPYAQIGYRAMGKWMEITVSVSLNIGMFAVGVILLVLVANLSNGAIKAFARYDFDYCYLVLVMGAIVTPFTLLKSPKDFWWAIIAGMVCTLVAVLLAIAGTVSDAGVCGHTLETTKFDITAAGNGLGTIFFAYGGHACFPTIQHDMKQPYRFSYSASLAYTLITVLYVPLIIMGNLVYHQNLQDSVLSNIQSEWIQDSVHLLITAHCMFAMILIINPVMQTVEKIFKAPQHFCWQRCVIRIGLMALLMFVAETLPNFGPLMGLLGGTVVASTSFQFPVMFYVFLKAISDRYDEATEKKETPDLSQPGLIEAIGSVSWLDRFLVILTFVVGTIVMVVATVFAVKDLATASFKMPCYLRAIKDWPHQPGPVSSIACCGPFGNLSRPEVVCNVIQ